MEPKSFFSTERCDRACTDAGCQVDHEGDPHKDAKPHVQHLSNDAHHRAKQASCKAARNRRQDPLPALRHQR